MSKKRFTATQVFGDVNKSHYGCLMPVEQDGITYVTDAVIMVRADLVDVGNAKMRAVRPPAVIPIPDSNRPAVVMLNSAHVARLVNDCGMEIRAGAVDRPHPLYLDGEKVGAIMPLRSTPVGDIITVGMYLTEIARVARMASIMPGIHGVHPWDAAALAIRASEAVPEVQEVMRP